MFAYSKFKFGIGNLLCTLNTVLNILYYDFVYMRHTIVRITFLIHIHIHMHSARNKHEEVMACKSYRRTTEYL